MSVPSNLVPTRILQLPEDPSPSNTGWMMYVNNGVTYKVQVNAVLNVSGVPSTRQINAGTGLTGGGDLSQNRTISVAPGGIGSTELDNTGVTSGTYGSNTEIPVVTVDANGRITSMTTAGITVSGYVPTSTQVIAGTGLTGGGALNTNVTLNANLSNSNPVDFGTASPGVSTSISRSDHVHPAVNLTDLSQTEGVLDITRGGTGNELTAPAIGGIVYSDGTQLDVTESGTAGDVLVSNGFAPPNWVHLGTIAYQDYDAVNITGGTITGVTVNGTAIDLANQGLLKFYELTANGTNYVALRAPASLAGNTTYTLPSIDGSSGQFLTTNGSGALSWSTPVGAGDVSGPASSTDNAITRFDGTTGKVIQNSGVIIDDSNNVTLQAEGSLRLADTDSTNYVGFKAPATVASDVTWTLPSTDGTNGQVLTTNGSGVLSFTTNGSGTVTSVGLALPSEFTISNSPVTSSGTLTGAWANQTANYIFAAPNGSTGTPTFRAMVAADVPTLNQNTTGNAATATNVAGGDANKIVYQTASNTTNFIAAPTVANTYLEWSGSAFQWSANPLGTVTSVSGTGTVSGITLSGTVTTSGSLTLGGSLDLSSPPAIGGTLANTITGTTITATTKVVSPYFDAVGSAGGALRNASGTSQLQWGAGGGNNVAFDVATNINPANAKVDISPTGTGYVDIKPAGALTLGPTTAGTINNMSIGATTAATGRFTTVESTIATGTAPFIVASTTQVNNLTAQYATNVAVTADATNTDRYLAFLTATSGNNGVLADSDLKYNPSTNALTAGSYFGDISNCTGTLNGGTY